MTLSCTRIVCTPAASKLIRHDIDYKESKTGRQKLTVIIMRVNSEALLCPTCHRRTVLSTEDDNRLRKEHKLIENNVNTRSKII